MAQYFYDFKGSGSRLPDFLTPTAVNGALKEIVGGDFLQITSTAGSTWVWCSLPVKAAGGVTEILVKIRRRRFNLSANQFGPGVFLNGPGNTGFGVFAMFNSGTGLSDYKQGSLKHDGVVLGAGSILDASYDAELAALDKWSFLRLKVNGNQAMARAWWEGHAEPASWSMTGTYTAIAGRSKAGIICTGLASLSDFSFVGLGTDGSPAPSSNARKVTGTVRTPEGNLAVGYVVNCYLRSSGVMLATTLTDSGGTYTFALNTTEKVFVLAIDQLGNSWNSPMKDLILPITP